MVHLARARAWFLTPILAALVFCSAPAAGRQSPDGTNFYVSPAPAGKPSGTGSLERPWDLQTALSHPASVRPGDTIWLRAGVYSGTFTSQLRGAADAPISVRQYPGERVTLDGGSAGQSAVTLAVSGQYTWFWGFEITGSSPNRVSLQSGSAPSDMLRPDAIQTVQAPTTGPGLKFINLTIHDARQGVSFWKEAVDAEIYGCLIYYNGWQGTDRGHGHGIYTQNQTGVKRLADNIIFDQFGGGIQAYGSSSSYLNNFDIEGNTSFENGALSTTGASDNLLVGGGVVTNNDTIRSNVLYYDAIGDAPGRAFNFGYTAGCTNGTVTDNYMSANAYLGNCPPVTMTGNTFHGLVSGFNPAQYPDNTYLSSRPTGARVLIRPNHYEPGRANITVFNWDLQASVSVDLGGLLAVGERFEIRNAHDFFGDPVVTGTFAGGPVAVPMAGLTVASPIGWPAPQATGPEFNVFVLLPLATTTRSLEPRTPSAPHSGPRAVERPARPDR